MKTNNYLPKDPRILQLTALLFQKEVKHIVLCPGSRNIPLIQAFTCGDRFLCHRALDERHAAFLALGMAQSLNQIVAIVCTSGTALLNFAPAVAEAFYSHTSLLVISADRPLKSLHQNQGQTLDHLQAFNGIIAKQVQLPAVYEEQSTQFSNRLINEVLLASEYPVAGPTHINIPIQEPFFDFSVEELPKVRSITIHKDWSFINEYLNLNSRVMLIIGHRAFSKIIHFPFQLSSQIIVVDEFNQIDLDSINIDSCLDQFTTAQKQEFLPDIVVSIGGDIVSKRLKKYLQNYTSSVQINISSDGKIVDTFDNLSHIVVGETTTVLQELVDIFSSNHSDVVPLFSYRDFWKQHQHICNEGYSSQAICSQIVHSLPHDTSLFLANSSIIRGAIACDSTLPLLCNRGCSGIEGSLSTAVGSALVNPDKLHVVILGDLSYYYDINALTFHSGELSNLFVFILNNQGGAIFNKILGAEWSNQADPYIRFPHTMTSEGWSKDRNCNYIKIQSQNEWIHYFDDFNKIISGSNIMKKGKSPLIIEILVS